MFVRPTMFVRPAFRGVATHSLSRSAFHSSAAIFALTREQTDIVKSTVPVLAEHGVAITTHFYKRMLAARPELKNIFNMVHQNTGAQPAALAHAVWAYADNIDNLGALAPAVSRIAHKHASLGITPEQYPIVGEHLLASIKEVLGEAATPPIIDAWAAAYGQLADVFIGFERNLYETAAATPGGWNGWREFVVERKARESGEIISFYLAPKDGKALPPFKPGQFVSVRCFVPALGVFQPRQYSLSDIPSSDHFRISVKREFASADRPPGQISNVLHDAVPEGAVIDVSMPYGDFTLDTTATTPVVLVSGGVGLTPMMSMLQTIVEQGLPGRRVVFVHAVRNRGVHAMGNVLSAIMARHPQVSRAIYYEEITDGIDVQGVDYDHVGRVDFEQIKEQALVPEADYYLCGPVPFMNAQRAQLENLGVNPAKIHSEVFGSA